MKTMPPERAAEVAEYVRSHWRYDHKTGEVCGRGHRPVGTRRPDGALQSLAHTPSGKVMVLIHRAAWLLRTGEWPDFEVDHENGVRSDNRWVNLRHATHSQNRQNLAGVTKKGRLRGATRYYNKWKAQIKVPGESAPRYLGLFATEEEAHAAYCWAKAELHPFNPEQR